MNTDQKTITDLVEAEVARASSANVSALIRSLLVTPRCEERPWGYGPERSYPCWIVAEHPSSNTCFAYCEKGFGPKSPWGLLFISGNYQSIGMDCGWFQSLEEAVLDSCATDQLSGFPSNGA